ncbi:MAG: hypothetical protein KAJ35_09595, partial [Thermoplasmata archaeon]|nr:hypothetical protein [Thermoplasmata archaeon]
MAETVTVGPGEAVEHDFYIVPGYVTGTIDLWGANTDIYEAQVYANYERTSNYDAYTFTKTEDYKLILYEGDWIIGVPDIYVYFDYDTSTADIDYDFSFIRLQDEYKKQYGDLLSVEAGKSYEVDYSFGTAMVTLNYQIEGGGELYAPDIRSFYREFTIHEGVYIDRIGYGRGSDDLTTQGEATITLLEGRHHLTASAYAEDGSYTRFGRFWIEVEAGDVIVADLDAPNVVVTEPTGLQHVSSSSVTVEGTATDDNGVVSVTVNGVSMTLTSTSNPDDANEVSFTTTVTGLSYGENTITVVATDEDSKTTKVERTVIRDNDPPEADAGGPYEGDEGSSISFDASGSSDPQGDVLTYRWDFDSDGTWDTDFSTSSSASHTWSDDYTGTVTVQVFDGVKYTTDTAEVTVYNVAPTIDSFSVSPGEPVKLGDLTTVSAGYTDPGSETLSTTIDWGDETSTTATGDSIEETHEYATTGVYTITLSVTDGVATVDTIYRYVVVYNTDGGFVTGGGWIDSPEGAYVADETLSGRANFGFVSK